MCGYVGIAVGWKVHKAYYLSSTLQGFLNSCVLTLHEPGIAFKQLSPAPLAPSKIRLLQPHSRISPVDYDAVKVWATHLRHLLRPKPGEATQVLRTCETTTDPLRPGNASHKKFQPRPGAPVGVPFSPPKKQGTLQRHRTQRSRSTRSTLRSLPAQKPRDSLRGLLLPRWRRWGRGPGVSWG